MKLYLYSLALLSVCLCDAYKILLVYPYPFRSLNILGHSIAKHLHNAGHEVTLMTAFPLSNLPEKNFHQIDISGNQDILTGDYEHDLSKMMKTPDVEMDDYSGILRLDLLLQKMTLEYEHVQKLLADPKQQFDLVILDILEVPVLAGLSAVFDCPYVFAYSRGVQWSVLELIDQQANPAYTADHTSTSVPPFTFRQRVAELWTQIKAIYLKRFVSFSQEEALFKQAFGPLVANRGRKLPAYGDVMYNASLVFANDHYAASRSPATPQNFRFIGGQHIESPVKPLPQDLQKIMDAAKDGVIYFSMGSIWKSKDIPKQVTEGLLQLFGSLKQTVIWKYEDETVQRPKNVHLLKWTPQQSIFAHPNCRLFISHGGLLSSLEAISAGIPMIGIPVVFDQFVNVHRAIANGYGVKVDLSLDLADDLKVAIQEVLTNDKYTKRVKELSAIDNHRLVPPHKELVHWVEHVVRTRGAPHLRSPALLVPFYQKMYLDLLAVIIAIVVGATAILAWVFSLFTKAKVDGKKKRN